MALSLNLSSQSLQYQIGGTVPTAQSLVINFGRFLSAQYPGYTNLKLLCIINTGLEEWISISGSDVLVNNEINISATSATINIDLLNLSVISAGNYYGTLNLQLSGEISLILIFNQTTTPNDLRALGFLISLILIFNQTTTRNTDITRQDKISLILIFNQTTTCLAHVVPKRRISLILIFNQTTTNLNSVFINFKYRFF